jgi:glucose-1-phosphate thymidylyltransferase
MIAILLCAGYATRMYPLTKDFPKPLLPVAHKPVIDYLIEQLIGLPELRSIHVVTNAKFFKLFESWQNKWSNVIKSKNIIIKIHNNGSTANENRRGAVADLKFVLERIPESSRAIVSPGDNIHCFQLEPILQYFIKRNNHCIVALPEFDETKLKRTGVLLIDEDNRVLKLYEKPKRPPSKWFSPALYFLLPSLWSELNEFIQISNNHDELGYFIDYLCQEGTVYAYKLNASRFDIGNIDSYRKADECLRKQPLYL